MLTLGNKLSLNSQPIYKFVNKYSVDFDGVDDRIITDGADTVAQPTTYSFWCKSSETGVNNGVFGHGLDRTGAFHFNRNADRPQLFLGTNYYVFWNDNSAQDDGEWHHWVVYSDTNDITNSKLYVDGVLQSQSFVSSSGSLNAYTESLTIGSDQQLGGNSFEGKIDEFAVYDRELTQAEITKIYNDGSPINLNLNAGDYQSANPLITSTKSMEFDGVDDYLEVQDDSSLQLEGSEASWTFWTRLDSLSGGDQKFIAKATTIGGANAAYQIRTDNADLKFQFFSGAWRTVTSSSFFTDLNWVNVTVTIDASNIVRIYKNGVETLNSNIGYSIPANTGEMLFGARTPSSPTNFLNGEMTEVGIYNRCLTALEVASLYNQGVPTNLLVNRNNYQSGNPTVFNTKQVDFDGTDDYLKANSTLGSFTGSISAWVKRNSVASVWRYIIDFRSGSGGGYFAINNSHNIDVPSGTVYVDNVATITVPQDNEWHHIVVTGITLDITESIIFGSRYNIVDVLNGEMSQVGLWNSTLTADEVSSLYNHGLPIDLTTDQAAYSSSSNLVGYWRMGSGTLDSYPLIADQTNATLGSELVTNGDFATDSDWTKGTGWTISGGVATSDGTATNLTQGISIAASNTYEVTFTISSYTSGAVRITLNNSGDSQSNTSDISSAGTHTAYLTVGTITSGNIIIDPRSNFVGSIDNVSVKQVQGNPAIMTNQTSSDIENGSPYANLINNGDFANWTGDNPDNYLVLNEDANNYVTESNGQLRMVSDNSATIAIRPEPTDMLIVGKIYKVSVDLTFTTGTIDISGKQFSTSGTKVFNLTAPATYLQIAKISALDVLIDNLSVEEVNTGLQGYWKMGDGTNDEYRIIFDQTNPTLGNELVVCGDFACANPDSAWSRGTGWTISDGVAKYDGSGGGNLDQTMDITNGYNYKVTFTILNSTQGILGVYLSGGFGGNFGNGTHTILIIGGSASSYDLRFVPISSFIGELDNVSVKEISGNPAAMTNMVEGNITNQYPLTKIRNYYRMGDGILDGYPIIQDQTSPNLAHIPTTNLATYSENFTTLGWTNDQVTVTTNSVISPDGTQNASTITPTTSSSVHLISTTGTNTVAMSVYAKQNGYTRFRFNSGSSGNGYASFNLSTGVVAATGGTYLFDSGIEDVGNGWFRCFMVLRGGSATNMTIAIEDNSGSVNFTGDGTSGIHVWGAQSEDQLQPTTYIKSDGIAAVRKSSTTNLLPYSEDFSQWTKLNAGTGSLPVLTSNTTISPDGTQNASTITFDKGSATGGGDYSLIRLDYGGSDINGTASIYLKSDTNVDIEISPDDTNYQSVNVTNEWQRFSIYDATSDRLSLGLRGTVPSNNTATVYAWGAQLEEQTQAETYAKTTGLPVTISLFTENNYGTMTNMSASDIVEDTP